MSRSHTAGGYVPSMRPTNRYAIVKLEEDEPKRYLTEAEPAEWSERRAKAIRFRSKDDAQDVITAIRGPGCRRASPFRIVPIEEQPKETAHAVSESHQEEDQAPPRALRSDGQR